jgi:hypothetical protein
MSEAPPTSRKRNGVNTVDVTVERTSALHKAEETIRQWKRVRQSLVACRKSIAKSGGEFDGECRESLDLLVGDLGLSVAVVESRIKELSTLITPVSPRTRGGSPTSKRAKRALTSDELRQLALEAMREVLRESNS